MLQTLHQVPCSSGFSLNIGDLNSLTVANVEVWSGGLVETPISGYNYHFNMLVPLSPVAWGYNKSKGLYNMKYIIIVTEEVGNVLINLVPSTNVTT